MALSGDRVVRDRYTGLTWQGCVAGLSGGDCTGGDVSPMTWQSALAFCDGLVWAGFDGWRLPSWNELQSIVDYDRHGPAIDPTAFPETPSGYFWSSSSHAGSPSNAWLVVFSGGCVDGYGVKSYAYYARCVRGRVGP